MRQRIAVEPDLTPVKEFLSDKGFQVESVSFSEKSPEQSSKYDAIVVSGINSNFLGMSDTGSRAVVIYADGLTPEQVYHELNLRLS